LRWEQRDLAEASGISLPSIKRLETQPGPLSAQERTLTEIRRALEKAGIEFIAENGGGARAGEFEFVREDPSRSPEALFRAIAAVLKSGRAAIRVTLELIFERDAFGIALLEPFFRRRLHSQTP
jgi:hypothetical protein